MNHFEFMKSAIEAVEADAKDEGFSFSIQGVVTTPKGQKQDHEGTSNVFDHEYVDQSSRGYCEDCYSGFIYYHLGEGYYLKVWFDM